jgi:hypothetical protein
MTRAAMNRRRNLSRAIVTAACLLVVLGSATVASACPSCKAALNGDGSQGDLARGIYYSVLFMMSVPFAVVGTFGGLAYRAVKREQRRLAEAERQREFDNRQFDDRLSDDGVDV